MKKEKNAQRMREWRKDNHEEYLDTLKRWRENTKKNSPWFFHYRNARNRFLYRDLYKARGFSLTIEQTKALWFRDNAFLLTRPSIDRIDGNLGYSFENCRFIEFNENSKNVHRWSVFSNRKGDVNVQ